MGMFTETYVNVDLKASTPDDVITVLKAMCGKLDEDSEREALKDLPDRWRQLFSDGSYYTSRTHCKFLERDTISKQWALLGKGDIKNYRGEIQEFFEWISPWVDGNEGDFIGYSRYEESQQPQLYFLTKQ